MISDLLGARIGQETTAIVSYCVYPFSMPKTPTIQVPGETRTSWRGVEPTGPGGSHGGSQLSGAGGPD